MAKPLVALQPLPGMEQMQFLLDIVRDADSLKDTLDAIEAARARANERIALVGPADEIQGIKARVQADEKMAAETLAQAKTEGERLIAEAQARANQIVEEAAALEAGVKQALADAEKAQADAIAAQRVAEAETAGVKERERKLDAELTRAADMIAQAAEAKKLYDEKLAQFRQLASG